MIGIVEHIQRQVEVLNPVLQVGIGLLCVFAGLLIWLGGMKARAVLVILISAAIAFAAGWFIVDGNIALAIALAVIAAFLARVFEKAFVIMISVCLAVCLGVIVQIYLNEVAFTADLKQLCWRIPIHSWLIIAAPAIVFAAIAFYLTRFTAFICFAFFGTLLIFSGMILLLTYKGTDPVAYICGKSLVFLIVLAAMIAFGAIEQLLLDKKVSFGLAKRKAKSKDSDKSDQQEQDWRGK